MCSKPPHAFVAWFLLKVSLALLSGLLLQLLAVVAVLRLVGSRLLMYNGALLIVVLGTFHGVTEIANILYPANNPNLVLIDQESVDRWVLLASVAMLSFSTVYAWTFKRLLEAQPPKCMRKPEASLPLLLGIAVPSFILAATAGNDAYGAHGYFLGGLSQALFLLSTVMCFIALIMRSSVKWMLPILLVEAVLFTLLGSRLTVIAALVMTAAALTRYGRLLKFRELSAGLFLLAALSALVSSTRSYFGRETYYAPARERIANTIQAGLAAIDDPELDLKNDFLYRFDGNIFPAMVNERFRQGYSGVGLTSFAHDFFAFTPSFIYTSKLDSALEDRNERAYADAHFGLPGEVDLPTTLFTILFGYYGAPGLMFCAVGLGLAFAYLDRWVNSSNALTAYVFGLALSYCCIFTEQGVEVFFSTFRSAVVLLLVMRVVSGLRRIARQRSRGNRDVPGLLKGCAADKAGG